MFIQPDWFEVTKAGVGTNRYAYSFNDPVNNLDPNGNFGLLGAAIGGFLSLGIDMLSGNINSLSDAAKSFGVGAVSGFVGAGISGKVAASFAAVGRAGLGKAVGGAAGGAVAGATSSVGDQAIQLDPDDGSLSLGTVDGVEVFNDATKGAVAGGIAGKLPSGESIAGAAGGLARKGKVLGGIIGDLIDGLKGSAIGKALDSIDKEKEDEHDEDNQEDYQS